VQSLSRFVTRPSEEYLAESLQPSIFFIVSPTRSYDEKKALKGPGRSGAQFESCSSAVLRDQGRSKPQNAHWSAYFAALAHAPKCCFSSSVVCAARQEEVGQTRQQLFRDDARFCTSGCICPELELLCINRYQVSQGWRCLPPPPLVLARRTTLYAVYPHPLP